ncbi:hypothetical protein [Alcanivorax hongdengensis]|uniref:hypothetical protein n=1 Tax=Alcanivorax hongdengensis TaxID=519051 RepID=UPI0012FA8D35|nr:hypothetical protein [Alcanivorax hongdengensis]
MSRRHFDDYDPKEWQEEHDKSDRERRKRDAKKHRHQQPEDDSRNDRHSHRPS